MVVFHVMGRATAAPTAGSPPDPSELRRIHRRARDGDRGFTMVEVLVTMLLLTIILLGLTALQIATIRQVSLAKRANGALRLGQAIIERYQAMGFADLPSVATPDWETVKKADGSDMVNVGEDGEINGPFSVHHFIEIPSASGDRIITVRVSWLDLMPGADPNPANQYRTLDVLLTLRRINL